jgi:PAS domain S-box-containing protein
MDSIADLVNQAAVKGGHENMRQVLVRIRSAFEHFDSQSVLLQSSFDSLKRDLAETNRQLNEKNRELVGKVEELQVVSSRLHCILESLADGVLVVNDRLMVERCNAAAENMLSMERSAIEGCSYAEIMNGLGNIEALRAAISCGQTLLDEQRSCTNPKGHKVVVLASVAPVRTTGGVVLGAVEVLRDVTQVRLLEERMQHQKRMAALGEMATSVAHEIRNPLGTIEGFARLLKGDLERARHADHARLAGKIIEGAQNLNYVITNLLTYARPMSVQYDPFDVASLLNSVSDMLAGLAEQARVRIDFRLPSPPLTIHGDIRHLRQVLVNLGRNAIEASPKGGEVIMEAVLRRREVVFSVTDSGCGIGPEDLPRVFDPFFTRKEGGTGLGLSLCHKIVAAHGGEISISSVVNHGTTVKVVLSQFGGEK